MFLVFSSAVEYDYLPAHQCEATLETKKIGGLFLSGQINGTTGYEEAGAQGIIAGMNAARLVRGEALVTLPRESSYIGTLIDDLVTKDLREPYRVLTSRWDSLFFSPLLPSLSLSLCGGSHGLTFSLSPPTSLCFPWVATGPSTACSFDRTTPICG